MRTFLTAEWRHLVMINFVVDPDLLVPRVPNGTELDVWQGRTYLSVVGFLFLRSKLWGIPIPFHSRFEEINLRFYVRRESPEEDRRGVVFIREFVPKRAVAGVARLFYGEPYRACPMDHRIRSESEDPRRVEYRWRYGGGWNTVWADALDRPETPPSGSEAEFITEHYWGYTALPDGRTREYEVRHAPWMVRRAGAGGLECDVGAAYGPEFVAPLSREPSSIFVADGSRVSVHGARVV